MVNETRIRNVERDNVRHYRVRCYFDDANRFTYHSGISLPESDRTGMSPRFVTWQIIMCLLCRVSCSSKQFAPACFRPYGQNSSSNLAVGLSSGTRLDPPTA